MIRMRRNVSTYLINLDYFQIELLFGSDGLPFGF